MTEHNGILFYRQGRYIDCMRHIPAEAKRSRQFQSYDANYKIEVNFPSSLDESFGISTNKQYVNLPYQTLTADGWVKLMTESANLYRDAKNADINEELKLLENANAAIQAIDDSDKILNREGSDPVQGFPDGYPVFG